VNMTRGLYIAAALLAAGGAALRFTPISRPTVPAASVDAGQLADRTPPLTRQAAKRGLDSAAADPIIAANILAQSRTPPTRATAASAPTPRRPATPPPPALTLVGTTIGPQGAVAIINTGGGSQVHAMGDLVAGARLVAISESTVTLLRPSGPLVLHVAPTAHENP
jgi:hypothetical protein